MNTISQIISGFRNPVTRQLYTFVGLMDAAIFTLIITLAATRNYVSTVATIGIYVTFYFVVAHLIKTGVIAYNLPAEVETEDESEEEYVEQDDDLQ